MATWRQFFQVGHYQLSLLAFGRPKLARPFRETDTQTALNRSIQASHLLYCTVLPPIQHSAYTLGQSTGKFRQELMAALS